MSRRFYSLGGYSDYFEEEELIVISLLTGDSEPDFWKASKLSVEDLTFDPSVGLLLGVAEKLRDTYE